MNARLAGFLSLVAVAVVYTGPVGAQDVEDVERLRGLTRLDVRAEAAWDEAITMEAGGATSQQFLQALEMTFREAMAGADGGPEVAAGSKATVACHVDTFYEPGQIVYSLRVQVEEAGADGAPVIVWIRSWVGSFTVQQLHLMFSLGERCADTFLDDWRTVN